jgi:hypothetical protein
MLALRSSELGSELLGRREFLTVDSIWCYNEDEFLSREGYDYSQGVSAEIVLYQDFFSRPTIRGQLYLYVFTSSLLVIIEMLIMGSKLNCMCIG